MIDYSPRFYREQCHVSYRSAKTVLPIIFRLVTPQSLVDVGCGVAPWLAAARELGITDMLGIDGDYVDRSLLMIPPEYFMPADLSRPVHVARKFDLAICVEVAEHLPDSASCTLVNFLTTLSPVILFSAAIPGQVGVNHLNEQWPPYWEERFADVGFVAVDCIRSRVWERPEVEICYAQNCLLFVQRDYMTAHVKLLEEYERFKDMPRRLVHPATFDRVRYYEGIRLGYVLQLVPGAAKRALQRRASLLWNLIS